MAGAHSPSNAFAHLQHHQHNGLLGPSMQVRDPHISLMQPSASFASALWSPAPQPFPYITTLSSLQTVQFSDSAWMSCSFNHFDMTCIVLTVIYYGYSEPCATLFVNSDMPCLEHVACGPCLYFTLCVVS